MFFDLCLLNKILIFFKNFTKNFGQNSPKCIKNFENFLWNFWKKSKFYIANISQKSCVFKWIFKKMILKIFYDVNFLEKNFKLRFLEIVPLKNLVFNWICSQIYHSLGPYWSYSLQMKKVLQSFQTYCAMEPKKSENFDVRPRADLVQFTA